MRLIWWFWFAVLLSPFTVRAQTRIVPHVTSGSDFTTDIFLANSSALAQTVTLSPYTLAGNPLADAQLPLPANTTLRFTAADLFLGSDVSHFFIDGDAALVQVTVAYRGTLARSTPAQSSESRVQARIWRLFPGDWSETWDGVAVVNTELETASVVIEQMSSNNQVLARRTIASALPPRGKALFVIGPDEAGFSAIADSWFRIESSHQIAVMALRGTVTGPQQEVGLLWENDITILPEASLHSYASYPIGSAASLWRLTSSPDYRRNLLHHFNALTPENEMKMQALQPLPGQFTWEDADALVSLAQSNNMQIHGHTLVWHESLPAWVYSFEGDSAAWEQMLKNHVQTVAQHFKGKVHSWDVVNESYEDSGQMRDTIWRQKLGNDYQARCFQWAREADPTAVLYYNDFNLSGVVSKLNGVLAMADDFRSRMPVVPLDGIGFQVHVLRDWPDLDYIRSAFESVTARGLIVKISELDVRLNEDEIYTELTPELKQLHKERVRGIVALYQQLPEHLRGGITVWGISDADTWVRYILNRADWPLLLDEHYHEKPAFHGFREGLD